MPYDIGIRQPIRFHINYSGVTFTWIKCREKRFARFVFKRPIHCTGPTIFVGDFSVFNEEGMDHAVSAKPVVGATGSELRIGSVSVEGSMEVCGY